MSQHPPHIVENQLVPNAFIPFCSFSGNMSLIGKIIADVEIPVCDGFRKDTVDGRLCFTIYVDKLSSNERMPTMSGKGKGLVFVVDKGLSIGSPHRQRVPGEDALQDLLDTKDPVDEDSVTVFIATPHRFTARRQGRYMMTALKKMNGTKSFANLPDKIKECQMDSEGECKRKKFRTELVNKCGCLPWALKLETEV